MGIIYLTRHGETDYNLEMRYMGQKDIELNETGRKQSDALGTRLKNENINVVIISPLTRCKQTAEIVNKYLNKKIIIEPRLIERSAGEYEGLTKKEVFEKFPENYKETANEIYNHTPPRGESVKDVKNRVFRVLEELKKNYYNKKILVIVHGFVARVVNEYFNSYISKQEFYDFVLKNTEVKKFKF